MRELILFIAVLVVIYFLMKKDSRSIQTTIKGGSQLSTSTFAQNPIMDNNGNSAAQTLGFIPAPAPLLQPLPTLINPVALVQNAPIATIPFDNMRVLQQGFDSKNRMTSETDSQNITVSTFVPGDFSAEAIATSYANPFMNYSTSKVAALADPINSNELGNVYSMISE